MTWIIMLTVVLVTPHGHPDMQQTRTMASLAQCWAAAQAWTEQDIAAAGASAIGFAASCQRVQAPGEDG